MVLNYQTNPETQKRYMEIGFLDARTGSDAAHSHGPLPASSAVHIPRLLTTENGVGSELVDFRNRRELGTVRRWELSVDEANETQTPLHDEVTLKGTVPASRTAETDANKEDFGWIVDFENHEMHDANLTSQISTARLLLVLTVKRGEFVTRLLSPSLIREEMGAGATPFGKVAGVTGVDIRFTVPTDTSEASVNLLAGRTLVKTLTTKKDSRVFEISNAPPDVLPDEPISSARSHFHMYYEKLFIQSPPDRQFDFRAVGGAPAPDPLLCGVAFLGQRDEAL